MLLTIRSKFRSNPWDFLSDLCRQGSHFLTWRLFLNVTGPKTRFGELGGPLSPPLRALKPGGVATAWMRPKEWMMKHLPCSGMCPLLVSKLAWLAAEKEWESYHRRVIYLCGEWVGEFGGSASALSLLRSVPHAEKFPVNSKRKRGIAK